MRTTSLHIKDIEQRPTTAYSRDMHDVNEIKQMATHGAGASSRRRGAQLWGALERALSRYPAYCDIFPHCSSGFQIWFDPSKPPGRRIGDVRLKGALLQPRELYRVCATPRLAYHCLGSDAPRGPADVVMDAADGPCLPALLRNLFVDHEDVAAQRREDTHPVAGGPPSVRRAGRARVRLDEGVVLEPDGSAREIGAERGQGGRGLVGRRRRRPGRSARRRAPCAPQDQRRIHRGLACRRVGSRCPCPTVARTRRARASQCGQPPRSPLKEKVGVKETADFLQRSDGARTDFALASVLQAASNCCARAELPRL